MSHLSEITAYPCYAKPIGSISIGLDRGRFVISLKHDITASHPDSYMVGANCRGFVTVDVLVKGLSRGAIATG